MIAYTLETAASINNMQAEITDSIILIDFQFQTINTVTDSINNLRLNINCN